MKLTLVEPFAVRHHSLVTLDAVRQAGMSKATWLRAIHAGVLELVHPGVARMIGSPITREQRIAAAVLAAGPGALASHRSAAWLWGVRRPADDPPELILPQRSRQATLGGVVVHRPRDQACDEDPCRILNGGTRLVWNGSGITNARTGFRRRRRLHSLRSAVAGVIPASRSAGCIPAISPVAPPIGQ